MLTYSTIVPATIGDLQCDCIVDHVTAFNSSVTEHPIEGGFVIADHVARQAMKLSSYDWSVIFLFMRIDNYDTNIFQV